MKNIYQRLLLSFVAVFLTLIAFDPAIFAQDLDDVSISGRIVDSNNAPIAGATVTATLTTNGVERTVIANEEGRYRIIELAPGIYSVKASMQGFAAQEKTNLETIAGQNVQLDFNLAPAGVSAEQIITLEGENEPIIDTTRTIVGGTVTQREIEELPNSTRNPLDLIFTLGGTSEESLSTRDLAEDRNAANRLPPTEQGNFSLSGGASYSNNITIDGLDNNDDRAATNRFQPSLESIAEVQVITNQFSAEYGRASGGRVNLRTKSGTNQFRGRAFMFFRDDNLNANTYYNNFSFTGFVVDNTPGSPTLNQIIFTTTRPPLARLPFTEYNPGFVLSGPVTLPFGEGKSVYDGKNRTFFSVAYEYNNLLDTTLIDAYVPIGTNSRFALPSPTETTQACETNSTTSTCTNGGAGFISPYKKLLDTPNRRDILTARIDHRLFKNNEATFGLAIRQKTQSASKRRFDNPFGRSSARHEQQHRCVQFYG